MRHFPLLLALGACAGADPVEPEPSPSADGAVRLIYTGHGEGEIEPCG